MGDCSRNEQLDLWSQASTASQLFSGQVATGETVMLLCDLVCVRESSV